MVIYQLDSMNIEEALEVSKVFLLRDTTVEQVRKFLFNENNYLLVCKHEKRIVGFAYGYELQRFDGRKNMMYMHQIEVLSDVRQIGIGTQLMERFIDICKQNDCEKLFLITNKSNAPAITLYKTAGGKYHYDDDIVYSFRLN